VDGIRTEDSLRRHCGLFEGIWLLRIYGSWFVASGVDFREPPVLLEIADLALKLPQRLLPE
jgi:hypothetical protein